MVPSVCHFLAFPVELVVLLFENFRQKILFGQLLKQNIR